MAEAAKAKTTKPRVAAATKAESQPTPAVVAKGKAKTKPKATAKRKVAAAVKAAPKPAPEPKAKPAPVVNPRANRPKRAPDAPPAIERADRKTRVGLVVSAKMEKTVVVKIERRVQHPIYGKVVLRTKHFKAHDIIGCDAGDRVEIMETRPISKQKRWRVTQILEKVK